MGQRDLRPHQQEALERLRQSIIGGKRRPLLQAPTGYGKTVLAAEIIERARSKGNRVAFVVPAISLIDQAVQSFHAHGLTDIGVIQADHHMTDWSKPVQVCSIQTIGRKSYPDAQLVIVDEAHKIFKYQRDWMANPNWQHVPFIGLSATPWARGLGKMYDDLIVTATTAELIEQGYLSSFRVFAPSHPDLSGVKTVAGDYHEGQLSEAMQEGGLVADIVQTWIERGEGRPTLCFAVDRAHAKKLQHQFEAVDIPTGYVDAYTDGYERQRIGDQFHAGQLKVVVNIGTLTTGVDWDVRCIILARPTRSEMLFCLDSETEILTSHGWKGMGEVRPGDCAAACLGSDNTVGIWSRVNAVVKRDMRPDERWVEYHAPRANFRVTDQHRMIFRGGNDKSSLFRIGTAEEMVACKGGVRMPTAVHMHQTGVPLTDHELYFIGMMMADGTWTATSGSISQSERHPEVIKRIEAALHGCGIGYAKRRVLPGKGDGIYERHPRWVFHFSAGKPKPHKSLGRSMCGNECKTDYDLVSGITGYRHLIPYLDKDFSPALFQMSRHQLLRLLDGLWDGDGSKKKGVDYTPRSMEICSARKLMLDRLQALCAVNGMTANVRDENGASRKTPIWLITITPKDWRSVGGYASDGRTPRPQIEVSRATEERVWCVETEAGTIITRRRGKVTVMGNCQIIGRGLRTADGKDDLIVLDHSDTHLRLGFVTDILHERLDDGRKGDREKQERMAPLPKECPKCAYLKPAKVSVCPSCGYKPERQSDIETEEGELQEITRGRKGKNNGAPKGHVRIGGELFTHADFYAQLSGYANARGYKTGWAANKYREKIGVWPNAHRYVTPREPGFEVSSWIKAAMIRWAKRKAKDTAPVMDTAGHV